MKTQRISTLALALSALHLLPASVTAQPLPEHSSPLTTHPFAEAIAPLVSQHSHELSVAQSIAANAATLQQAVPNSTAGMEQAQFFGKLPQWLAPFVPPVLQPLPVSVNRSQNYRPWMSPDVQAAWQQRYLGQGRNITVVDEFRSGSPFTGNLQGFNQTLRHGDWTALQAGMIAPGATLRQQDFANYLPLRLYSGLNVINMSYGIMFNKNVPISIASLSPREASIASYAKQGQAVAVKSAGNDGVNMGSVTAAGTVDQLSRLLRGSQSGIFVGSLKTNGSKEALASMASYSNKAGKDSAYQKQFLVVGVDTAQIRIAGTSFAAPIVSGYAAILGSKFTTATPTQVTNQLLNTARQDTVANYSREVHGRGEASLSRALAPTTIR